MQVAHEFKFVVLLWGKPSKLAMSSLGCPVLTFEDVVEGGQPGAAAFQIAPVQKDTLATLVFTSGTTGNPKVNRQFLILYVILQTLGRSNLCSGNSMLHRPAAAGVKHVLTYAAAHLMHVP